MGSDTKFIADFISTNQLFFEYLNLSCCQLTSEGFEALLDIEFENLTTLILRGNDLQKGVGFAISKILGSRGKRKAKKQLPLSISMQYDL